LQKIKSIQIATDLQIIVGMSTSCKDGIIVTGVVYPKNPTKFSKVWLFVVKLDTCSTPVWQKMIELKEEYLDTTITNSNPIILNVNVDDLGNIYLFSTNELSNSMKSEKTIFRNSAFIYKLSPNGELLFRKPILNRSHTNLDTKRTEFYNNHFYLTGIAFFPLFGEFDSVSTTYASRSVILKIDTSGLVVNSKIIDFNQCAKLSSTNGIRLFAYHDGTLYCATDGFISSKVSENPNDRQSKLFYYKSD
jgi:hypothetical protein